MSDLFVGFVFVVMTLAPAIIASMQWSKSTSEDAETLPEDYTLPQNES